MNSHSFMVTMVPGLEEITARELEEKIPDVCGVTLLRGKVMFESGITGTGIRELRTIDNAYLCIQKFQIGKHKNDLQGLYDQIYGTDLDAVFEYISRRKKGKILLSASRKGKHTYSRFDLSDTAQRALLKANGGFGAGEPKDHDFAFRLDVTEEECLFSFQLTEAEFKFRGGDYDFSPGCIRPSIAHALVRMSGPKDREVFYDPFCGSGSIPKERAAYKSRQIYASDLSEAALNRAVNNLPEFVETFCCDATKTPLRDRCVDVILTNLPWGKQIEVGDVYRLYRDFLREAGRILTVSGRLLVFTDRYEEIEGAAEAEGMVWEKRKTVSLHGLLPCVYEIKRGR